MRFKWSRSLQAGSNPFCCFLFFVLTYCNIYVVCLSVFMLSRGVNLKSRSELGSLGDTPANLVACAGLFAGLVYCERRASQDVRTRGVRVAFFHGRQQDVSDLKMCGTFSIGRRVRAGNCCSTRTTSGVARTMTTVPSAGLRPKARPSTCFAPCAGNATRLQFALHAATSSAGYVDAPMYLVFCRI